MTTQITCPHCQFITISSELQKHGDKQIITCKKCEKKYEAFLHDKPFVFYSKIHNPQLYWNLVV